MIIYNNPNLTLIQDLKIIQHNVLCWTKDRSIELCNYYHQENPDIILLNSTSVINNNKIKIYNYNVIQRDILNERSAGVAIAIKKTIKYKAIDDFNDDILGIELLTSKGPIIILTNYSPPRRNYIPIGEIENILQKNTPVYFAGDINANIPALGYAAYNNNGRVIKRLIERDKIKLMGPDFRTLIHIRGKPDMVFSNKLAFLNYAILQGKLTSSDHLPVIIKLSTKPIVKEGQTRYKYKTANWELFKEKIEEKTEAENINNNLSDRQDIDAATIENNLNKWMSIITETRDKIIPKAKLNYFIHSRDSDYLKLLENTYKNILNKPFWSRNDLDVIKEMQRRILEENLRLSKEAWENKVDWLNEVCKDSAKFWGNIKKLIGSDKERTEYLIDINNNNNKVYKDEEKEILYRNIWQNIFEIPPEENRHFDQANENRVKAFLEHNQETITPHQFADLNRLNGNNVLIKPVTVSDVNNIIKKFKNKAPGISGINKLILSNLPVNAIERYSLITNLTLSMGYYPYVYKNGLLIFTPKQGKDHKLPENYRPITLLEVPGKILERIINDRFMYFCEDNEILNGSQFGFRKRKGTDTAIPIAFEKIAANQQHKNHCNVVCRDVAKAFDRVWIEGLQYKILTHDELPILLKKILCSFTFNRTAQIRINSIIGPKFQLKSGVPQGSILSPTLFIFYTHDLPLPHSNLSTDVIFANDVTQVVEYRGNDREQLAVQTEREIVRVNEFEKVWKIKTNPTKFKMISISKTHPYPISVDDNNRDFTNDVNLLGLTLKRTGFTSHIQNKIYLAKQQLLKLQRFYKLDPKLQVRLYTTLVRPVMEYPPIPNALASRSLTFKMQRVQNKALKYAVRGTDDRDKSIEQLHTLFGIDAINVRLHHRLTKTWSKIQEIDEALYDATEQANNENIRDHLWWPRVGRAYASDPPDPIYTAI